MGRGETLKESVTPREGESILLSPSPRGCRHPPRRCAPGRKGEGGGDGRQQPGRLPRLHLGARRVGVCEGPHPTAENPAGRGGGAAARGRPLRGFKSCAGRRAGGSAVRGAGRQL